jgi:hypothetical protein
MFSAQENSQDDRLVRFVCVFLLSARVVPTIMLLMSQTRDSELLPALAQSRDSQCG